MPRDPEDLLEALDPEQRQVATTFGRPVAVIAGAGSGKTRAITHRIAYGAATGRYDVGAVLAVTFTVKAAGELRGRLRALGVPRVQARTFHSAALRQAQYFWPQAYGSALPRLVDNRIGLVAESANRLLGGRAETGRLRDLATEIGWAKVSNVVPADYAERAEAANREVDGVDHTMVGRIYDRYEKVKTDRGVIDFDDVLLCAVALLSDQRDVLAEVRRVYRHLLVDEFQDVSPLQHQLLELWGGSSPDLCVVGDPAQTIHSFAGASASYLTGFAVRHRDAEVIRLDRDYRSSPQVVSVANRLLRTKSTGLDGVRLRAMAPAGPEPSYAQATSEADEAAAAASWLAEQARSGVPFPEMAILYRIHAQSPAYEAALTAAGIPFTVRGSEGFFDRAETREALSRLRGAAVAETDESTLDAVQGVLAGMGWLPEPPQAQGSARERWESLAALLSLTEQFLAEQPDADLGALNQELALRAQAEHAPAGVGVTLSTLHAAKGLEWEAVAIVGVQEGTLPFVLADTPEQQDEERRLLYVGVTRARSRLRISWATSRTGGGARRAPSRFLDGIRPDNIPVAPPRRRAKQRTQLTRTCRVCGKGLGKGAEQKLGRHVSCDSAVDERTWDLLREWRRQEAQAQKLPAFCIFTDATLLAIAETRPANEPELLTIPGVGRAKSQRYGEAVLGLLTLPPDG